MLISIHNVIHIVHKAYKHNIINDKDFSTKLEYLKMITNARAFKEKQHDSLEWQTDQEFLNNFTVLTH